VSFADRAPYKKTI
jgi:hypothetical protein